MPFRGCAWVTWWRRYRSYPAYPRPGPLDGERAGRCRRPLHLRALCRRAAVQLLADRAAQLAENSGLDIFPSHTHYFLGALRRTAAALKRELLARRGLFIRDAANFRGLTSAYFRLCTLRTADNQLLINVLVELIVSRV